MITYNISSITLQQIQVFLSVAETLNFSRSSQLLGLTQPGVSKSISAMEDILEFPLFTRTSRHVALTDEGILLYQKWKNLPNIIQNGYAEAKSVNHNDLKKLNIGVVNTTDYAKYFWNVAGEFQSAHTEYTLNVEAEDMKVLENSLADDIYDLVFLPDFEKYSVDTSPYRWKYAAISDVQIIVPTDHELAKKDSLTLEEISHFPVTLLDPAVNPNFMRNLQELYQNIGAELIIGNMYRSNFQLRFAQKTHRDIHITDDFWEYRETDFSRKIPLQDYKNGIICVWKKGNTKRLLQEFLKWFPA